MSKEKQMIEEMARYCCNVCEFGGVIDLENNIYPCAIDNEYTTCHLALETAEALYNAGYRKQSEGEWLISASGEPWNGNSFGLCSRCGKVDNGFIKRAHNFCPNCGARMKGESK